MDKTYLQEREAFLSRAYEDIDRGLYESALLCARERLDRFPGDVDSWLVVAACHVQRGRLEEAEDVLEKLDRLVPGWFQIAECLGDVCRKKGMAQEALRHYRRARLLDEKAAARIAGKIDALEEGLPDEAVSDGPPERSAATLQTVTVADLYIGQGHLASARELLETILRQDPSNRDAEERVRFVKALMSGDRNAALLKELNRWSEKLSKMRKRTAQVTTS